METENIFTPQAPEAVVCFPSEPNIPEGLEYEKYQHHTIHVSNTLKSVLVPLKKVSTSPTCIFLLNIYKSSIHFS